MDFSRRLYRWASEGVDMYACMNVDHCPKALMLSMHNITNAFIKTSVYRGYIRLYEAVRMKHDNAPVGKRWLDAL